MEDIREIIKKQKTRLKHLEMDKENKKIKEKLDNLIKQNGENQDKLINDVKKKLPKGYFVSKIPSNLKDITIGNLRTIHASVFGKEPPHDSKHTKDWIANKIKEVISN